MNGDMKLKARRILRALNNMREGRWRECVMPPEDRLDAAWLVHRYRQLRDGTRLFSEASMQAGTEFLLMVIQGDERVLKAWADTSPLAWCPQDQAHRLTTPGETRCGTCGAELVVVDLEEEWAEYKGRHF